MKNFSTAALVLALSSVFASAQALSASRCEFLPNAPDSHVVVRGDTLWGISGKFLQQPWCWPEVWGMNRDEIKNPHWIYPGQIVYFDRAAGRLRLGQVTGAGSTQDVRLSPQIRMEAMGRQAVPAIAAHVIEPFLSQPLIIEGDEMQSAPRIVATPEDHVYLGRGDRAYVRGELDGGTSFQAFRPGVPLKDPVTKAVIGHEAVFLGTLKLQRKAKEDDEAHTFVIVDSKEEIGVGDRLMPVPPSPILNYMPHRSSQDVDARVVSIYGGVAHAGQNQIVTINRGKNDNIDIGTVLELYRYGPVIADRTDNKAKVKLPDEQYGTLFIFRVFNAISYGLIMQVNNTVQVGDLAKSPE